MGIEEITGRIMDEVNIYENDMMNEARIEVEKIMETYKSRAEKFGGEILDSGRKNAAAIVARAEFDASIIRQNQVLQMKSNLIDEVFKNAEERISMMPEDNLFDLFFNILDATARPGKGEIIFNEYSKEKLGKKFVAAANKNIKEIRKDYEFILSDECADIKRGFILRYEDVEINCSVEKMMDSKRAELMPHIANILFGDKNGGTVRRR